MLGPVRLAKDHDRYGMRSATENSSRTSRVRWMLLRVLYSWIMLSLCYIGRLSFLASSVSVVSAYYVNDTTLELYLSSTIKYTNPYTQALYPSQLLQPTIPSLAEVGSYIDSACTSNAACTPSQTAAPCFLDVPLEDEDDFSGVSLPFPSIARPPAPSQGDAQSDFERHAYYQKHRVCSFIELMGTHNVPFSSYGRAAVTTVNTSKSLLFDSRWVSGEHHSSTASTSSNERKAFASEGNKTMVTVVATRVTRVYWVNETLGAIDKQNSPVAVIREPSRGVFLRLVGLSTMSQWASALKGSQSEAGFTSASPSSPIFTTSSSDPSSPFASFSDEQQNAMRATLKGIRSLLRRIVSDQEAFDALWSRVDNAVSEADFEDAKSGVLRILQESPAILFDTDSAATEALDKFASFGNFTRLLRIAQEWRSGQGKMNTSVGPPSSEESDYRSLLLQREALLLFSSWAFLNNNNLRGTTAFTDINGVAEFPHFRGLDCVNDMLLWVYVRRRVPSLSDEDAVKGLKGVNRTVVLGDMRVTLRPVPRRAFVLADTSASDGGQGNDKSETSAETSDKTETTMTWEGALFGAGSIFEMTRTFTATIRRSITRTLVGVAESITSGESSQASLSSSLPLTTAHATTAYAPTTTTSSAPSGDPEADVSDDGDRTHTQARRHVYLRESSDLINRSLFKDIGEIHNALRFVVVDSCGRFLRATGRLALERSQGSIGGSSSSTSANGHFSRPALSSSTIFGGGLIGSLVSEAQRAEVQLASDLFTNLTNRHSPRHAEYSRVYFKRPDFSVGIDGATVSIPAITAHPSVADPFYLYRFSVDEPYWSYTSSEHAMRSSVWRGDRPWTRRGYTALSKKANTVFNVPPLLRVWGVTFDCVALAQNITDQRTRASIAFKLSARSEVLKGLSQGHGYEALSRLPSIPASTSYAPFSNPLALLFSQNNVIGNGWDDKEDSSSSSNAVSLPEPLAGVATPIHEETLGNGTASTSFSWSPMSLSSSDLFPLSPLAFNDTTNRTNRDPTPTEYILDGIGARASVGIERWRERRSITESGAMPYFARPLSWIANAKPTISGVGPIVPSPSSEMTPPISSPQRLVLDPTLFNVLTAKPVVTVTVDYYFVTRAPSSSSSAQARANAIASQKIPVAFSVAYGDEIYEQSTRIRFLPTRNKLSMFSQAFPLNSNEEQSASYNRDLSGEFFKAESAAGPASFVFGLAGVTGRGWCGANVLESEHEGDHQSVVVPVDAAPPPTPTSPPQPKLLRSTCQLSASEVSRRGLVISWVTPLNTLSNSIATRSDLMRSVEITTSHTKEAAPRAFMWASPFLSPLDLRYAVNVIPKGRDWSTSDGGHTSESGVFFFKNSVVDDPDQQNHSAISSSSAFLVGLSFVHQLYLPPQPNYYTHMDEDIHLHLLNSLTRTPYTLEQTNFSFKIRASDTSPAERARDWLSLIGMWGRTSSIGTISSITTVAGCSNDAGMSLYLSLYPLYFPIGEGPARYYVGAVIMNTVVVAVFCFAVFASSRFTSRFSDTFPNEAIILAFILYPGTAFSGMSALSWLNEVDTSLRYVVLIIVILHVVGFPFVFAALGYRRRPQWEQTKQSDEVDGKGDVLGGMSTRQRMALKKRKKRQQKQLEQEQLRTKRFGNNSKGAKGNDGQESAAPVYQTEVERIMAAMSAKLGGNGGRSQALSLLKFLTPEGHYVLVHSDHLRFEAAYSLYRGPAVNFVAAEVFYPFLISCCAFLNCPNNTYMALGLIVAHIVFTFVLHPHITLGRNLVIFAADTLLIVATALQIRGTESVSRVVFMTASLLCSCCNVMGLIIAFWTHRWWRGTVKHWNRTLRRWALRGPDSKRARFAYYFAPITGVLQAHLDILYSKRPDVMYRNKRRLTLMNQIVHQKMVNAQELDEEVELDPAELIKESAEREALGMVGREDSSDSLPEELDDKKKMTEEMLSEMARKNRKRAFSSYKKAVASAKADDYFDKGGNSSGASASGISGEESLGSDRLASRSRSESAVNRFLSATASRAMKLGSASSRRKSTKGQPAEGGVLQAPLLGDDDEDTYVTSTEMGRREESIHHCLYNSREIEEFYSRPEFSHHRNFDPFKLNLEDSEAETGGGSSSALGSGALRSLLTSDGRHLEWINTSHSSAGADAQRMALSGQEAVGTGKPRIGPAVLPSISTSFESQSVGLVGQPSTEQGRGVGGDGRSSASGAGLPTRRGVGDRRGALDRLSLGSAGERNAVVEAERLRRIVKEEKERFDKLNESRLEQYVFGSVREVIANPQGTLITPDLTDLVGGVGDDMDNASFALPTSPRGYAHAGPSNYSMPFANSSPPLHGTDSRSNDNGAYMTSNVSFVDSRGGSSRRMPRSRSGAGGRAPQTAYASASPNIADKLINRSHRHRGGNPSVRRAFGQDDDEGTVVHVFLTPKGMEESRVSTNAADRTLQIHGPEQVTKAVTAEASRRIRTAFESNVYSAEEVAEREAAMEMRRAVARANRKRKGRGRGSDSDASDDGLVVPPQRDIFGRYRKPKS